MMDIEKLLEIMAALRDEHTGCEWDRAQTFASIAPMTIEEAYEVADAIERQDLESLPAELGDLLFHVVYHARLGEEIGAFDFSAVVEKICEKLVRRHPHVFGAESFASPAEQTEAWDAEKARERASAGQTRILDGVARGLPGLTRACALGRRAARVGFDWPAVAGVRAKVSEELQEADEAIAAGDNDRMQAEIGDLLFAVANLCRHLQIDPERCIRAANRRFEARFGHVEDRVMQNGGQWSELNLEELDSFWIEAKRLES